MPRRFDAWLDQFSLSKAYKDEVLKSPPINAYKTLVPTVPAKH